MARELLKHAEAGRVTALVFVAGMPGGDVMRGHVLSRGASLMAMIGAASVLHQRLLQEVEWPDG